MTHLTDVNTSDIEDAVRLGCHCMCNVFDADDGDVPYFRVVARPDAFLGIPLIEHVPGRHLNALLNAADVVEAAIDEEAIDKHARAAFLSYSGPLPLSLGRQNGAGLPRVFVPHHVREGFHALYALVEFRGSLRARDLAEASIQTILDYWNSETEWDAARLEQQGIEFNDSGTFISGVARTIGPLVKYYRSTGHAAALELALLLKEKAIGRYFTEDGSYDRELFGTHAHSVTCTMSSLAQLADLTGDTPLMNRVKAFYDNGLWEMRDGIGWSIEGTSPESKRPDEGEMNNTGDILETALILGRWGYTEYYHDAERILRCHLLPSQLRDVSWIEAPANPDGVDALTDVAGLLRLPGPFRARTPRTGAHALQHRRRRRRGRVAVRGPSGSDAVRRDRSPGQPALRSRDASPEDRISLHPSYAVGAGEDARTAVRPPAALGRLGGHAPRGRGGRAPHGERLSVRGRAAAEPAHHHRLRAAHRGDRARAPHAGDQGALARRRGGGDGELWRRPDVLRAVMSTTLATAIDVGSRRQLFIDDRFGHDIAAQ